MISLAKVKLPRFGRAETLPPLPTALYLDRLNATHRRLDRAGFDALIVYGDREHSANLAYLTGFDPRFEESLLLLGPSGRRMLLVGNECMGYLPDTVALGLEVELFQEFSLLGQPRGVCLPLREILASFGIRTGSRVGVAGWKYFDGRLIEGAEFALDAPAYLVDLLRDLCGDRRHVVNATELFVHPQDGLRILAEPAQIAQFEYAGTVASEGVLSVLRHLAPGVREQELEKHYDAQGLPLSCHRMVSFGDKAKRGLASATDRRAVLGDAFTTAIGVVGSLTARAGCIARNADDLPEEVRGFYPQFAANYFETVAAWYAALGVGVTAGAVFRAADAARNPQLFAFALNPGHYLHLDEWTNSPFAADSRIALRSGMVIQADIIPVSQGPFCCSNVEDGVVLADATLQEQLAALYPACWKRLLKRRDFMRNTLGIRLQDTVFPLGNTPGWLPPYAMDLTRAFVQKP